MKPAVLSRAIKNINNKTNKRAAGVYLSSLLFTSFALVSHAQEKTEKLDTIVVKGTNQSRYEFKQAESVTGFRANIDELPRTVQVIPEQIIRDQNATNLTDVLSNAAGVTRAHGFGGAETQVNIRGFTNSRTFVNGNPVSDRFNIDVDDIERAEVILGPASILHGQVSPGGLINIVTKTPQKESAHALQFGFDENGQKKFSLDTTGPLSDTLQYRLVVSGENSDSFREVTTAEGTSDNGRESYSISPSISFTPDEYNTFTLRYNHTEQRLQIDRGTVALENADGSFSIADDIPRDRRLGSEFDERDSEDDRIQLDWKHVFNDSWINKFTIGYYKKEFNDFQARPATGFSSTPANNTLLGILGAGPTSAVQASNGFLGRTQDSNLDVEETDLFISNSLVGDFELAGIENTLYVGVNYFERIIKNTDGFALVDASAIAGPDVFFPEINVIDINSAAQPTLELSEQTPVSANDSTLKEFGFSIQNLSYLTDDLKLLVGLRYDRFDFENDTTSFFETGPSALPGSLRTLTTPSEGSVDSDNDNVSGQAGILYDINDNFSVYASYSESFTPNVPEVTAGVDLTSLDLDPEDAKQFEVGFKSTFFNDGLHLGVSVYELERENVLRFENLQALLNGEERTRGVDITSSVQITEGLNILASFSYLDSEIVDDNDNGDDNGNTPFSIPDEKVRIWGSYEFQGGSLAGLGLGLGAEYVGERFGNNANTFTLPSYTTVDTALWGYITAPGKTRVRLQAGVRNLFDREFFPANGSGSNLRINVGEPRTEYVTARLEF